MIDNTKITINTCVMSDKTIHQDVSSEIYKTVIDLKEKGIRDALISMGWTPPSKEPVVPLSEVLELLRSHIVSNPVTLGSKLVKHKVEMIIEEFEKTYGAPK